jgi:hypothetical protein
MAVIRTNLRLAWGRTHCIVQNAPKLAKQCAVKDAGLQQVKRKRSSNPPSQGAEPVLKCGYGKSGERSPRKTTNTGRDSADFVGVCN